MDIGDRKDTSTTPNRYEPSIKSGGDVFDAKYDPKTSRTPSAVVIDVVAAVTNTEPMDLPPLYDSVDTDALNSFVDCESTEESPVDSPATLSFQFSGTWVTVINDGQIFVEPSEESIRSES